MLEYSINSDCVNDSENLYSDVEELQGIKRFKVFKYFDDLGIALPFKTEYDIENNKILLRQLNIDSIKYIFFSEYCLLIYLYFIAGLISANIYSSGIYCIIDIAKWLDMLEFDYSGSDIIFNHDYSDDADETGTDYETISYFIRSMNRKKLLLLQE